jgi:hypothetical protein
MMGIFFEFSMSFSGSRRLNQFKLENIDVNLKIA